MVLEEEEEEERGSGGGGVQEGGGAGAGGKGGEGGGGKAQCLLNVLNECMNVIMMPCCDHLPNAMLRQRRHSHTTRSNTQQYIRHGDHRSNDSARTELLPDDCMMKQRRTKLQERWLGGSWGERCGSRKGRRAQDLSNFTSPPLAQTTVHANRSEIIPLNQNRLFEIYRSRRRAGVMSSKMAALPVEMEGASEAPAHASNSPTPWVLLPPPR